jgi:hypothetical protein
MKKSSKKFCLVLVAGLAKKILKMKHDDDDDERKEGMNCDRETSKP